MRRASAFCLALGYAVSWIVVCLSACMIEPAASEHACCADQPGVRAVLRDCCSFVPTVQPDSTHVAAPPPPVASSQMTSAIDARSPRTMARPVRASASPPLVLRV
jgi:hypothetical protein